MSMESSSRTIFLKAVAACVVVAVSMGLITVGEYKVSSDESSSDSAGALASLELTPGTYTASAAGIQSDVSVTCTFDENSITSITVDVSGETDGIGADIGDEMIEQFMSAQGSDVDGVSGATITSDALKAAMDDCIAQAAGSSSENSSEAATEVVKEDETEFAAEEETETEYVEEAESEQEIAAEEEAGTEPAVEEASPDVRSSYLPGTYTAAAAGHNGDISVSVLFNEDKMLSISYDLSCETEDIGAVIGVEMSRKILQSQSADVDGISGATVTSNAFCKAVSACIDQAESGTPAPGEGNIETENTEGDDDGYNSSIYVPGTYTAAAAGHNGDISVSVLFNEDEMLSISYDLSGETEDIGAVIGVEMSRKILQSQSADVDGVSGATETSDAFCNAVNACIEEAKSGN